MISKKVSAFLHDAKRFVLSYLSIADSSPLQLYSAALVFAPKTSVVRNAFQKSMPDWISQQPDVEVDWNAVLQTLEGHSGWVTSVAFSHDSKLLASASWVNRTVQIWDTATGRLQQAIAVDGYVSTLLFDITNSILITNVGRIKVDRTGVSSSPVISQDIDGKSVCEGLGISRSWITWNSRSLLWIPPSFGAYASDVSHTGSTLAIGCASGRVLIIGVSPDILRNYYS